MSHSQYIPQNRQYHHQSSGRRKRAPDLGNVKPPYRKDSTIPVSRQTPATLTKTELNEKRLKGWLDFAASLGKSLEPQSTTSVFVTSDSSTYPSNSHLSSSLSYSVQSNDQDPTSQTQLGILNESKLQSSHNMQNSTVDKLMQQQSLAPVIKKDLTPDLDKTLLVNDIFRQIDLLRSFYNQAQDRYEEEVRKMLLLHNSLADRLERQKEETQEASTRYETDLTSLELQLRKEGQLRQNYKVKAFEAEASVYLVREEIKNLKGQLEQLRQNQPRDLKCRECNKKTISIAILPCFHASLCEGCADLVSKCTVFGCDKDKLGIQKIFIG